MANEEGTERALTWADTYIRDLLAEEERYQDVIKDLSDDAIRSTTARLDDVSEAYLTGLVDLQNRAASSTSYVLVEVDEEVDLDAFAVSTETAKVNYEAYDWFEQERYDTERATSAVLIEINADIDRLVDEVRESNESTYEKIDRWLSDFADDLHSTLWGWVPELTNDAAIYLAALPARLLFESFKSFFFEED